MFVTATRSRLLLLFVLAWFAMFLLDLDVIFMRSSLPLTVDFRF